MHVKLKLYQEPPRVGPYRGGGGAEVGLAAETEVCVLHLLSTWMDTFPTSLENRCGHLPVFRTEELPKMALERKKANRQLLDLFPNEKTSQVARILDDLKNSALLHLNPNPG